MQRFALVYGLDEENTIGKVTLAGNWDEAVAEMRALMRAGERVHVYEHLALEVRPTSKPGFPWETIVG